MTTPNQPLPATLETLLGVGAFQIGGGGTTFGQDIDEDFVNNLVKLPFATLDNMIDILQMALLRLPIEALQAFSSLIPDWLEDSITDVASAVDQIIDALQARDVMLALSVFEDFIENMLDALGIPVVGDLLAKIFDLVDGVDDWFGDFDGLLGNFDDLLGDFNILDGDFLDLFETLGDGPGTVLADIVARFQNLGLTGLFDASALGNIANIPAIAQAKITGLVTALSDINDWIQDVIDTILHALTGIDPGGTGILADVLSEISDLFNTANDALSSADDTAADVTDFFTELLDKLASVDFTDVPSGDLFDVIGTALSNIPFLNVSGVGGPGDIGSSLQTTWDQLVSGFTDVVGAIGATLPDVFGLSREVSSRATLGQFSWDILGIRSNKSLKTGFLPSSQANIPLTTVSTGASMSTVPITQSTALLAYDRILENMSLGVVSWQGSGITSITHCFIAIYKMNTSTGVNTLVHESTNQVGLLSGTMAPVVYSLPTPIDVEAGDVYGFEIAVRGAGTHNVAGTANALPDQAVYPRRFSSVRNSGTSAAPSSFTPTYGTNVPFIEYGVSAGDVSIPHSPETYQFNTVGSSTLAVPGWVNTLEIAVVGSGGGGASGTAAYGVDGEGGDNGSWNTTTWTRGTHFSGAFSVTWVVGAAGSGGSFQNYGTNGSACSASISGYTCSGAAGIGGNSYPGGSARNGQSPGNQTLGGVTYVGGGTQTSAGGPGSGPGGGGAGGGYFGNGGNGAVGSVWIRFKQ